MLSVVGLQDNDIQAICKSVQTEMGGDTVCQVANYLFPMGRVVPGDKVALDKVATKAKKADALRTQMVAVSGAFHTPRMQSASEALKEVTSTVTFNKPRIPIYSNVTAKPFTSEAEIPAMLARQLVEPVMWEATIKEMIDAGKTEMFELGPAQQIKAMIKKIDMNVWKAVKNVSVDRPK